MKRIIEIKIIVLILFALSFSAFGQTPNEIEKEFVQHLKNIDEWTMLNDRGGEDLSEKLASERKIFRTKLLKHTKQLSTLKFKFANLAKHMFITTSPDSRFRVYSWDTLTGGTMHFFDNVYQYKGRDGKIYSKGNDEEGNAGAFYTEIFQLNTKKGRVYLASSQSILSSSYNGQTINLFKVDKNSLNEKINLIKTKTRLTNSISFGYDFFSVVDRKERPIKLFQYNEKTRTIIFPIVIENKKFPQGEVTNRSIKYRFNGRYFVRISR